MKRFFAMLLILICAFATFSCSEENATGETAEKTDTAETSEDKTQNFDVGSIYPLMKLAFAGEQDKPDTEYLQYGDGVLYFAHASEGYTCGYFDMKNSVSSEDIITLSGLEGLSAYRIDGLGGYLIGDGKFNLIEASGGAQGYAPPEGAIISGALIDGSSALIYENEKYILTAGIDFETQYVLCEKASLPGYAGLIAFDGVNNRVFYATKNEKGYTGYAYFDYGKSVPEGETAHEFSHFLRLTGGGVLFVSDNDDSQVFTVLNPENGERFSHTVSITNYSYGYSASADGSLLALYSSQTAKCENGYIDIIDMRSDKRTARFEITADQVNPGIVLSPDGEYVFFGILDKATDTGGFTENTDDDVNGELINLIKLK